MKVITPGHAYELALFEDPEKNLFIQFIQKEGKLLKTVVDGTTNEEVLAMMIDRLRFLNEKILSSRENSIAITKLEEALMWLNKRTADRKARGVEGTHKA
jgi:hypothetical protein